MEPDKRQKGGDGAEVREAVAGAFVAVGKPYIVKFVEMPAGSEGGTVGSGDGIVGPSVVDEAGVAVVSATQERAVVFEGAEDRVVEMLPGTGGFPVPAVVGDGDEKVCAVLYETAGDFGEDVLEADVYADYDALDLE